MNNLVNRPVRCILPALFACIVAGTASSAAQSQAETQPLSLAGSRTPGITPLTAGATAAPAAAPAVAPNTDLPPTATPSTIADRTSPPRLKIGLVLSGGGARGLSHIGVLKVLEELHVPVDYVAATSMGSIVGGLYATGMSVARMEQLVRSLDWSQMFSDMPPRPDLSLRRKDYIAQFPLPFQLGLRDGEVQVFRGAISGANLELWLHDQTRQDDNLGSFDELPIPFRAVATDMVTGEQKVFRYGPLYEAIRASMSVPGLFSPVEVDGHVYGDGGLVNNLPVDVMQAMGADIVIAINIGTPLMSRSQLSSIVGLASQSINILTEQNVREQLARLRAGDVLIQPDMGELTFLDFTSAGKFIDLGEAAARAAADRLRPLSLTPQQYAGYTAARNAVNVPPVPTVRFVDIEGTKNVNPKAIARMLDTAIGKPFNVDELASDVSDLYGTGDFDRIEYRLIDRKDEQGLRFDVSENAIGPNYLRFGINFSTDLQGESRFNAVVGYQATWLNRYGLEWTNELELGTIRRFSTELYQPLGAGSRWFASLYGEVKREPVYFFDDTGKRLAEYSLLRIPAGLDLGYAMGRYGEVRVGYSFAEYRADLAVGTPPFNNGRATENGVAALFRYDQLDNPYFPRSGLRAEVEGFAGRQNANYEGSKSVERARVDFLQAFPVSKDGQVQIAGKFTWSSELDEAIANDYQLGGFLNLSGLKLDQLSGDYLGFARAVYTQRMGDLSIVGRAWYLGASAEVGNAWKSRSQVSFGNTRKAASLFIGLDTYLGPFYVAYGRTTEGDSSWYIFLGRP